MASMPRDGTAPSGRSSSVCEMAVSEAVLSASITCASEVTVTVSLETVENQAVVRVSDNGCGMPEDVLARIWEPFFTTKGEQGNGLGLDIVKAVVESYGGTIDCEYAAGAGATFTIRLPRADSAATSQPLAPAIGAGSATSGALVLGSV